MISKGVGEEQVDQAFILPFMEDTYKILGEAREASTQLRILILICKNNFYWDLGKKKFKMTSFLDSLF
jgi:hypothetical protein